jgi:hypothetical protein
MRRRFVEALMGRKAAAALLEQQLARDPLVN